MSEDQRVYSEEEFALVLRKAAELAERAGPSAHSSAGLTLAEMKASAAQAGFDPALIERAAWMLSGGAGRSVLDRVMGGPLRHEHRVLLPARLDADAAARLLSAVRVSTSLAGRQDVGHAGPVGMTWHDGGDLESLRVTARPAGEGTEVSIALDRRGTLGVVGTASGVTIFFALLFSASALYPEAPVLGVGGFLAGIGGTLAAARAYWASSTRQIRDRIGLAMGTVGETLVRPEAPSRLETLAEGAGAPAEDAGAVGDARGHQDADAPRSLPSG